MIDIKEIDDAIYELEHADTNYANCQKLASLYVVKDHLTHLASPNSVVKEYNDILPSYTNYKGLKTQFQRGMGTKENVLHSLDLLCIEIREFLQTLYQSVDTEEEREQLNSLLCCIAKEQDVF